METVQLVHNVSIGVMAVILGIIVVVVISGLYVDKIDDENIE